MVLLAVGVLVGVLVTPDAALAGAAAEAGSTLLAVSAESYDGAHQLGVSAESADPQVVRSNVTGVVTRFDCAPGGKVTSGSAPLWVDGRPTLALATGVPLWRDLASGARGADVTAVQTELARLGYGVGVTGTWDRATGAAVRALWTAVGVTPLDSLPVASVVWLPAQSVTVGKCGVAAGDPVTAGQAVITSSARLTALLLATPPGSGWVVAQGSLTAPIDAGGRITDTAFLAAVAASPEFAFAQSAAGSQQGSGLQVTVRLAAPVKVLVVPPSAIVGATAASGTSAGHGCVVTASGPVPVTVVASSLGTTMVQVVGDAQVSAVQVQPDRGARCP